VLNKGVVEDAKDYTPLIGGAQGVLNRPQLQSRDITECLFAVAKVTTAGLKGSRTCDF
jgi:hypothetical protein